MVQTLRAYFEVEKDDANVGPALLHNAMQDLRSWHDGVGVVGGSLVDALHLDRTIPVESIRRHEKMLREFSPELRLVDLQRGWEALCRRWHFPAFHTSVQHSDLNVGNILIDLENRQSYIIDFASVKPARPVFGDTAKVMREVILRLHSVDDASGTDCLRGLESLFASLKIFLNFQTASKPLHDLPNSFKSAFSLTMNFGPWCLKQIEFIEARCGSRANPAQLPAELLTTLLFQCLLLLLPSGVAPSAEELGAVYGCHVVLDMLREKIDGLHDDLEAIRI